MYSIPPRADICTPHIGAYGGQGGRGGRQGGDSSLFRSFSHYFAVFRATPEGRSRGAGGPGIPGAGSRGPGRGAPSGPSGAGRKCRRPGVRGLRAPWVRASGRCGLPSPARRARPGRSRAEGAAGGRRRSILGQVRSGGPVRPPSYVCWSPGSETGPV